MSATSLFIARAKPFLEEGVLTWADVHVVALVAPRFGETDPERMLGLAFAVRAPRTGHAGVDLGLVARQLDEERFLRIGGAGRDRTTTLGSDADAGEGRDDGDGDDDAQAVMDPATMEGLRWPDPRRWQSATFESPMVGAPIDSDTPFVRQELGDTTLLLTRRMHHEQELVAAALRARAAAPVPEEARVRDLDATLTAIFPDEPDGESARAVRLAAERRLAIVIGGPGTGKTFSITRLLAVLLAQALARPIVIALAAPTGKAAVRMREAIREATSLDAKPRLDLDPAVRSALQALEATTLHRLLGVRPDGSTRHGPGNPIAADVVVVDEVSMVDLALMRRLVEGVHADARLVLLGDRDQLASVEAGCVLADLVGEGVSGPLANSVQVFTRSRRFASAPDVALIAGCLQSHATSVGDVPAAIAERASKAVAVFLDRAHASNERFPGARVHWLRAPEPASSGQRARPSDAQLGDLVAPYTGGFELLDGDAKIPVAGYANLLKQHRLGSGHWSDALRQPSAQLPILRALDLYRVLAVHRRGPLGVVGLDQALATRVRGFLGASEGDSSHDGRWHWIGRPILVTQNAPDVGLMNGDVGLVLPTTDGVAAVFPHDRPGELRYVPISRLPPHEGALAMTVHKSQGSQFDRVALVLAGCASPIQTRELVYTGITRAKNQLAWLGTEAELRDALDRRVARASGLGAMLR